MKKPPSDPPAFGGTEEQPFGVPDTTLVLEPTAKELAEPEALTGYEARYETGGELGRGGLGQVIQAYDRQLGRQVAIKTLHDKYASRKGPGRASGSHSSRSPTEIRFLDEARVGAQLEHPGMVPVYELGQRKDGSLYYSMRQVRGRTMKDALTGETLAERLALLPNYLKLCQAMAYAHSRGVIHRDLKPENVMLGEFGETVVLDWGLAKVRGREDLNLDGLADGIEQYRDASDKLTIAGLALGTPSFMPPEQALGELESVDERSDVYSLGAILFEIITRRPPFEGDSAISVLYQVVNEEAPPVEELERSVPSELAAICRRAMAKDPADRYPDAGALAEDVHRFQVGGLVRAHAYSPLALMGRWIRRRRALLAAALVMLTLSGGMWWYRGFRETRELAARERLRQGKVMGEVRALLEQAVKGPGHQNWMEVFTFKLISLKEPQVEALLISKLGHKKKVARRLAARSLGGMRSKRAVPALCARLEKGVEPSETVLIEVINALGIIGDSRADRPVARARWRHGQYSHVWNQTILAYRMIPMAPLPRIGLTADYLVDVGRGLMNKDRDKEALVLFQRAIALDPRLSRAYVNLALVREHLGDRAGALADYNKAISLDARAHAARFNRASIRRRTGDFKGALADLNVVVAAKALGATGLKGRALLHKAMGNLDLSLADLKAAMALQPRRASIYYSLAYLWRDKGMLDRALANLTRAIGLRPRYVYALSARAALRCHLGRLAGALADAEKAILLDPTDPYGWLRRAKVRLSRGDSAGSLADYGKAVALKPKDGYYRIFRAVQYHYKQGEYTLALADLREALALVAKREKGLGYRLQAYRLSALLRLGRRSRALRILSGIPLGQSIGRDGDVIRFLRGKLKFKAFQDSLPPLVPSRIRLDFYRGLKAELAGDRAGARAFYARALKHWSWDVFEYDLARMNARALSSE